MGASKYGSKKDRLYAAVRSLLKLAYDRQVRPGTITREDWRSQKERGDISDKALRGHVIWAEVQEKAELCLPPVLRDETIWPTSYSLDGALEEAWHVVYGRPRKVSVSVEREPEDLVEAFGEKGVVKELKKENKQLLEALTTLQKRYELLENLKEASADQPVLVQRVRTRTGNLRQGVTKNLLSDLHIEEKIDPAQICNSNEYNPLIAKTRLEKLAEGTVWKIETHRSMYDIKTHIVDILGDIITGYLHVDSLMTNYLSPFEAILEAKDALIHFLLTVLEEAKLEEIIVNCVCGNHGRNFLKPVSKNAIKNSFEWLCYVIMAEQLAYEERVKFNIATGEFHYSRIYDQVHRAYHGTSVRYKGGIGRLTVPLYSALKEWDKLVKANMSNIGHLHTFLAHPDAIVNGSIVGYSEYAMSSRCGFESPQQAFYVVDSHRGVRDVTAIWLDSKFDSSCVV